MTLHFVVFRTLNGVFPPVTDEATGRAAAVWYDIRGRISEDAYDVPLPRVAISWRLIPQIEPTFFNRYYYGDDFLALPDRWEVRLDWPSVSSVANDD